MSAGDPDAALRPQVEPACGFGVRVSSATVSEEFLLGRPVNMRLFEPAKKAAVRAPSPGGAPAFIAIPIAAG